MSKRCVAGVQVATQTKLFLTAAAPYLGWVMFHHAVQEQALRHLHPGIGSPNPLDHCQDVYTIISSLAGHA